MILIVGPERLRFSLQSVRLGAMRRAIGVLIALVVAAGCVSEDSTTPTQEESAGATTSVSATSTSALPGEESPLAQRLLQPGELAGVAPGGPPQVLDSASAFASGRVSTTEVVREAARLRRLGFVVASVQLFRRGGVEAQGVSVAVQLGSAEAARAELSHAHATMKASVLPPGKSVPFTVPGIPGARGVDLVTPGIGGGQNILFADGSFFYLVAAAYGSPQRLQIREEVITAASALYTRVSGLPPS